jgi:3-oxoacyl-[acyl-carrier-protein] synthase-3
MRLKNVALIAPAYHVPEEEFTSEALESALLPLYQRLRLPEGRLELMTGIRARRLWPVGTRPSDLSSIAAEKLILREGIDKNSIDLLIHASVCRDFLEPATASVVHEILGLSPKCQVMDLSNACLGAVSAMTLAAAQIELGLIKTALIVTGENAGPLVHSTIQTLLSDQSIDRQSVKSYFANLTIGSAATALILTRAERAPSAPKLVGAISRTDSSANRLCRGGGDMQGLMMQTDSEALLKSGVALARETWQSFASEFEISGQDIDWVIGHQVGRVHEDALLSAIELKDKKRHSTFEDFGNTGSSALPLTLARAIQSGQGPKRGEFVTLLGIGSGLVCTMMGVNW